MKTECYAQKSYRYTLTVKSLNNTSAVHVDPKDSSNWTTQGTIKANFTTKAGREFFNADQVQADQTHMIETPWNNFSATIVPEWRLELNSRIFQVVSVADKNEERRVVQITVKEQK